MKRALHLSGIVLLLGLSACAAKGDGDEILIGLAGPVSIPFGEAVHRGAILAIEEINNEGGIDGRMLDLDVRDDEMERERAITIATAFRDERKVVAVVGHVNSSATIAAADIYNHPTNGVLEISPTATSPELSGKGPWTFRVCPTDLHQGAALADWAYTRLGRRRAGVLYVNDEYGRGVLNAFAPAFEKLGGTIIAQDPFLASLEESSTTFDPYLERALRNRMDALILVGVGEEVRGILRAARRLGFTGPIMGADGLTDLIIEGDIAEGVYMTAAFLADNQNSRARDFVQRYTARFGEVPSDRAALTYDAVMLIARGLREVGPNRRALRDYIAGVGTAAPEFEGVTGTISLNADGDVVGKEMAVGVIRGGMIVSAQ
jgi:branched-chain amino acid transport system substrate-binding protein